MTHESASAYGLWTLVFLNSIVFIIFAFSFGKPQSPRDCEPVQVNRCLHPVFLSIDRDGHPISTLV